MTRRRTNSLAHLCCQYASSALLAMFLRSPVQAGPPPIATLAPQISGPVNRFANHMDVDGDRVLVGAYEASFIFRRPLTSSSSWDQTDILQDFTDGFGPPVALRGDTALFGEAGADTVVDQQTGQARLWRRSSAAASYGLLQTLLPNDAAIHDQFGSNVALGDGFGFIGADNDSHNGKTSTGTVTLFRDKGDGTGRYEQVKKFAPADLSPGGNFGDSMALDGDRLLVGASGNGAAYLYERNAGGADQWGQTAEFAYPTRFWGDDVALSGDWLAISRYGVTAVSGAVDLYARDSSTGQWSLQKTLLDPLSRIGDGYGAYLALSENFLVVSAWLGDDHAFGEAYVYGRNQGGGANWGLVAHLTSPDPKATEYFGTSVEIMDNLVLVGSLGIGENPLGSVYVYAVPEPSCVAMFVVAAIAICAARKLP